MAATVSPWGKPGAWALDSEEHEAELLKDQRDQDQQQSAPSADFPSLAAAAASKPKKKKAQAISLAEFTAYGGPKPSSQSSEPKGLTTEDLMMLPTGPRQRTAEELDRNRLGGGFKNYGSNSTYDRNNRYSNGEDSSNSRWGSSRVYDESRRSNDGFNRESRRESAPSRADEIDDWAAAKKPTVGNGFERRERGGFFDSHSSKADESDSWVSNKSFVSSEGRRSGGLGGGFDRERRGGFTSNGGGADSDNWGRKIEGARVGSGERPRLNLQPRTIPVSDGHQEVSGPVTKPKGSNPFGDARPREDVLAEKGQDWKKIDEQLDSIKIKDTVERAERPGGASFGRKGFGAGSGRALDERTERSWRKTESVDSRPQSEEGVDNEPAEEN